jgi:pseudouridine-5'-phosphate glycosidase
LSTDKWVFFSLAIAAQLGICDQGGARDQEDGRDTGDDDGVGWKGACWYRGPSSLLRDGAESCDEGLAEGVAVCAWDGMVASFWFIRKRANCRICGLQPGRRSGGLTVSAALTIASMIGIKVLATGAIGGVHRSATTLMDISADVNELGRRNVAVVCSGPKVYLDAEGTIEYLETKGVPVATFGKGTMEVKLPAHYSTEGELQSPLVLKNAKEAARMIREHIPFRLSRYQLMSEWIDTSHECGLETGQLLCNPIPYQNQLNLEIVEKSVKKYFKERKKHSKKDKEVVENMVSTIRRFNNTDRTVAAEKVMLMHNAQMAAKVAIELARIETGIDWFVIQSSLR